MIEIKLVSGTCYTTLYHSGNRPLYSRFCINCIYIYIYISNFKLQVCYFVELAESMMLKLSSMLNKVSLRQESNVIGVAR